MIIVIYNNKNFHYETLESIIQKYHEICNLDSSINNHTKDDIYLRITKNDSFSNYIKNKYPKLKVINSDSFPKNYDYFINATIYEGEIPRLNLKDSRNFFIAHQVTQKLLEYENVYFLTPLCGFSRYIYCDVLPFADQKTDNKIPVYTIQGNITSQRRNYKLLEILLKNNFDHIFKIRMVGRGKKLFDGFDEKIEWKLNLNFENYHKQFLDSYCILPLISKKSHPQYYRRKLTSTINYAKGYALKCIIDSELQDIYSLENSYSYNSNKIDDFIEKFKETLNIFYESK